ncbi:MAG: TetR/AcrR family transcriptional regulator [Pseudomonadota bacterium]
MTDQVTKSPPKTRRRSQQERGDVTKTKLLEAAIQEFSERGYDGVTLKDVETLADVQRGLVKYHYGGKEQIFKAVVDEVLGKIHEFRRDRRDTERDLSPRERLGFRIRSFVRYSAQRPELNRLMAQEGKRDSWRMRYILDMFLRQMVFDLKDLVSANLSLSSEEFCHWYYIYVGAGAFMFSMAPEAQKLFGIDVTSEEVVDRHAHMVAELLLSKVEFGKDGNTS